MSTGLKVIKSSLYLLAIQVVNRGLGIISTLILARLLTPQHFGIVALVLISIQFFELLVETGTQHYIVQKSSITDDDLNSAWSLDIVLKSTVALIIVLASGAISSYMETPELQLALTVSALTLPLRALKNPGLMQLAREINYQPFFRLSILQKAVSFIIVISIALLEPSHWAIIAGNVSAAVVFTIGSYTIHPFRPNWTLVNAKKQWAFSQWLLHRSIIGYSRSQADNLIVSKLFGSYLFGGYNLVREIATLPANSIFIPLTEPLVAALAKNKNHSQAQALAFKLRFSLCLMISAITPISVFIFFNASLIVRVLLGDDWLEFGQLAQPFSFLFFSFTLQALISNSLIAQGHVKTLFRLDLSSTVIIIGTLILFGSHDLATMAWVRGLIGLLSSIAYLLILNKLHALGLLRLCLLVTPSFMASIIAVLVVSYPVSDIEIPLVNLLLKGSLFVAATLILTFTVIRVFFKGSDEYETFSMLTRNTVSKVFSR